MTKRQKEVAETVRETGVCVLSCKRGSQSMRTARAMMAHGYTYYATGMHVAIGLDRVACKMNCIWANMHACKIIAIFDAPNMSDGTPKTASHLEWYQEYMVVSAIVDQLGMPYANARKLNREMNARIANRAVVVSPVVVPVFPATVNTPEETFAHEHGYMLNTRISALTAIPIGTERLAEIRAKKGDAR